MPSTNFFHVRNVSLFLQWIASQELIAVPGEGSTDGMFSIRPQEGRKFNLRRNCAGDFLDGLSKHLTPKSVAKVDSGEAISMAFAPGLRWGE